jgi:OOP family OmpA-OmpF porin
MVTGARGPVLPRFGRVGPLLGIAASVLFTACAGGDIERIRRVKPEGTPFTKTLTEEYREIAVFEADEMYDWLAAGYFARKGLQAAQGREVALELVDSWNLPPDRVAELSAAGDRLLAVLAAGARAKAPELAAHAQGRYDCWIEQQEENHQPAHIAACRDKFYAALTRLEQIAASTEETLPAFRPAAPWSGAGQPDFLAVLFFDTNSVEITSEGRRAVENALVDFGRPKTFDLAVIGHTDSTGSAAYNQILSLRRAAAVGELMIELGVPVERIIATARGEREPAILTRDGVVLQANRRVEILVVPPWTGLMSWKDLGPPALA